MRAGSGHSLSEALPDDLLVERYRANYELPETVDLTPDQVRFHLDHERRLTRELLESTPETRWETFERCYTDLYSQLPWLTGSGSGPTEGLDWFALLPDRSRTTIYEIGSGAGRLAEALAEAGCTIIATEMTRERGQRDSHSPRLSWEATDGINLEVFSHGRRFNAVISDQVVEHMHPDDLPLHFAQARAILDDGGVYLLRTPHAFLGPSDVSRVFGFDRPVGMHLKEYSYSELTSIAGRAGFRSAKAVFKVPPRFRFPIGPKSSSAYLSLLVLAERVLTALGLDHPRVDGRAQKLLRAVFPGGIWLVLER